MIFNRLWIERLVLRQSQLGAIVPAFFSLNAFLIYRIFNLITKHLNVTTLIFFRKGLVVKWRSFLASEYYQASLLYLFVIVHELVTDRGFFSSSFQSSPNPIGLLYLWNERNTTTERCTTKPTGPIFVRCSPARFRASDGSAMFPHAQAIDKRTGQPFPLIPPAQLRIATVAAAKGFSHSGPSAGRSREPPP